MKKNIKLKKNKQPLEPDFLSKEREKLVRSHTRSIRFNKKELDLIDKYCEVYKIKSKSSILRTIVISAMLQRFDEEYPKLF